jgi:hypothetical protein
LYLLVFFGVVALVRLLASDLSAYVVIAIAAFVASFTVLLESRLPWSR